MLNFIGDKIDQLKETNTIINLNKRTKEINKSWNEADKRLNLPSDPKARSHYAALSSKYWRRANIRLIKMFEKWLEEINPTKEE